MAYNYTKPLVPVAASYQGPGPTGYTLPSLLGQLNHDPRSVHYRAPAYQFGLQRARSVGEGLPGAGSTPGPAYIEAKLLRTGRDTAPAYTMGGKRKEGGLTKLPGPGDYSLINQDVVAGKTRSPAYSFGVGRREQTSVDVTPSKGPLSRSV